MVRPIHYRISVIVALITAAIHSESRRQQPQRINLITRFQIAMLEIPFRFGTALRFEKLLVPRPRLVILTVIVRVAARAIILIVVIIDGNSHLSLFHHRVSTGSGSVVRDISPECSRISLESAAHGDDIQNTAYAFRIVLRPR